MQDFLPPGPIDRRRWLQMAGASGLAALLPAGCRQAAPTPTGGAEVAGELMRFPGKVPMRAINGRPPCLETPWRYYKEDITPNEAFYVRWHLQLVPTAVDLDTWRLKIGGEVEKPLELSMDTLRGLEPTSVVAVNQCSGNSRGLFDPPVPGAQWQNGAMGNARWTGVPLRVLLQQAGLKAEAKEVTFEGLDRVGIASVPEFVKSLTVDMARSPDVLVAYEMNGQPLPVLNGFPVRLIVPGWYATYWVKSLTDIKVLAKPFDGYWMVKSYRLPATADFCEVPGHLAEKTVPIGRMNVRSFFTTPDAGASIPRGQATNLDGIAFDGGDGIQEVQVSTDDGSTWQPAQLGPNLGKYSFRRWTLAWTPTQAGPQTLHVKASNKSGQTQPAKAGWNRSGFMRNVIETINVTVVG